MASIEQALEWHRAGQLEHAERAYRDLIASNPKNADAANLLGLILTNRGSVQEAIQLFKGAVDQFPNNASFLLNYASALTKAGHTEASRQAYSRALLLQPESSETNAQYGLFLAQMNEFAEAEPYLRKSVEFDAGNSALRVNFGNVLKGLGKLEESQEQIDQALQIDGANPFAWNSLGECLQLRGLESEAVEAFAKAVEILPGNPKFQANLGLALSSQGKLSDANRAFEAALAIEPNDASFLASFAALKRDAGELAESLELFNRAQAAKPNNATIVSKYLYTLNFAYGLSAEEIDREHMLINRCFEVKTDHPLETRKTSEKIRLGFLSGDFRAHSVAYFVLPLLKRLDRNRFEICCYSQTTHEDSVTVRFVEIAEFWRPIYGQDLDTVCQLIREDGIDVLIDLAGHTAGSRLDVLADKPSPFLLNWLGYPNRVGLETFDGRIVDEDTDPEGSDSQVLDEPLFRMDRAFLAYEPPYDLPNVAPTPAIEKGYVTFVSFNNAAKLSDETLDAWRKVLEQVPSSKLLLKSWQFGDDAARKRIIDKLCSGVVSEDRLDLRARTASYEEHMALYGESDVALDPFPYNGTTTTCEALWMGLPVVTLSGDRHASRVGSSLLRAAGEPDFVASSIDEYIQLAVSLANDVPALNRKRLDRRSKMENSELGDLDGFARSFEDLLIRVSSGPKENGKKLDDRVEEGLTLHKTGDLHGAIIKYEAVLRKEPNRGDASHYCGVARYALGDYGEAVRLLDRATIEMPNRAEVWTHYGSALLESGHSREALEAQEKALALQPTDGTILNNYGNALTACGKAEEALLVYKRSLEARPKDAATWCNYSSALKSSGRLMDSVEAASKATELDIQFAGAWSMLGVALVSIGEAERGIAALKRAIDIQPSNSWNWSNLIFALQYSDTTSLEALAGACQGFGGRFSDMKEPVRLKSEGEPLQVGFVSADFREHAVARFVLPVLKEAKANGFETVLYSDSPIEDSWTSKLKAAATHWRSIIGRSDAGVVSQMHQDDLDALIDLGGHSSKNRLALFAAKPVLYQATWLGFPGSTGLKAIDARIADAVSVTETEENLFSERVLRLPEGFHTIDLPADLEVNALPSLSESVFTFGSFNNLSKASSTTLRLWADVLKAVPESRLLLKAYQLKDPGMQEKLREDFKALGVDSERLIFEDPINGYRGHLEAYRKVDVALDTFPYNGTTTTCEALWMGVPVITLMGDRSASRIGASLLSQVGLGDFVAKNTNDFVELSVRLERNREELSDLRSQLRERMKASSLGDAARFGRAFYDALRSELTNDRLSLAEQADTSPHSLLEGEWIEFIDFGDGRKTKGDLYYPEEYDLLPSELRGSSVLDVSCIDGFWAVKAYLRGAEKVVAIPAEGFTVPDAEGNISAPRKPRFDACRSILGAREDQFGFQKRTVYQIGEMGESFDCIVWFINSNFVRHPLMALDAIRSVCVKGFCLSVTLCSKEVEDEGAAVVEMGDEMPWQPSKTALLKLLEEAKFEVEEYREVDVGDGTRIAVVRSLPV